jgi:organic hydroperoxide reductase OsmC/OhrA
MGRGADSLAVAGLSACYIADIANIANTANIAKSAPFLGL